ncbi:RNA polymerase sigma factor [Lysobacter sp. TAB13]|uniref:RNA polymerase sigma factor n=1 Tax=Lysobacter sp. TAB13 TaxID=3233065 RepID=UPI003F9524E9
MPPQITSSPPPAPASERPLSSFAIDVPETLLARVRAGEGAAFEQIYRWFERPVFTLAVRIAGDRDEATDVLQETMLKVFTRIGDFRGHSDGSGTPFWGWLRQIAVNEALMRLRSRRRLEHAVEADDEHLADDRMPPPPAAADAAALGRAMAQLPAPTRSVLWLYHAEGYTHEEIAALMQRSTSFSKSQLARGGRRLRQLLEPEQAHA